MNPVAATSGLDSPAVEALLRTRRFFRRNEISEDLRTISHVGGRDADTFYRDRWSHDKVVRSTHGVNCTGSCSWKVYVKDGIITWETQQTDYPSVGPDSPEYEPRGCPRGAAFSWYTYSPTRVRYPYIRGVLLEMYREAKARTGDPVLAWAEITGDPQRSARYKAARGKGGLVRAHWDEAVEMIAAAHVHTIKAYGPDRIAGFSPIPAMSMVSHGVGSRFFALIGGAMLSFYDWYADLPVASPQVFGDQTDVPESADWWDAGYLIMWGSNLPVTRTPDAHWMTEARYRGQKVIAVSPDFADNVKFADEWLAPAPGTDGALAMAMGHVVGHLWRYKYDKFGWTTRSSQLYESKLLRWGSPLFHFGILVVFLGHVMGLGIPESWTEAVGISEGMYHFMAISLGVVAGFCTLVGLVILIYRRRTTGPVFTATTRMDKLMYLMLSVVIGLGLWNAASGVAGAYNYRQGVSIWFRGIFQFSLHPDLMAHAPLSFQLHGIAAIALFALWPFTRLVHVFSAPVGYLFRPYVVYRSKTENRLGNRAAKRGWDRADQAS